MDILGVKGAVKEAGELVESAIDQVGDTAKDIIDHADKKIDEDLVDIFKQLNQTLGTLVGDLYVLKTQVIDEIHNLLDRLNGTCITIPPRTIPPTK